MATNMIDAQITDQPQRLSEGAATPTPPSPQQEVSDQPPPRSRENYALQGLEQHPPAYSLVTSDPTRFFLEQVRQGGEGYLFFKKGEQRRQRYFRDHDEALAIVAEYKDSWDCYVSMGTFPTTSGGRTQEAVASVGVLWADVDAHGGGKYASVGEAKAGVRDFLARTGLPRPTYSTMTGYGVHLLWVVGDLAIGQWQPHANALWKVISASGLDADAITTDSARVLRLPGTTNFRNPDRPKTVRLYECPEKVEPEAFFERLERALHAPKRREEPPQKTGTSVPQADLGWLRALFAHIDPNIPRPDWIRWVWAAIDYAGDAGVEVARDWSKPGKTWDPEDFERVCRDFNPGRERAVTEGFLFREAETRGIPIPTQLKFDRPIYGKAGLLRPGSLVSQPISTFQPKAIEWLVEGAIPLGMVGVLGGAPGFGKSTIAISLAAMVTTGVNTLDRGAPCAIGSVLMVASEDDPERTLRPRLEAAAADISKVHLVSGVAATSDRVSTFELKRDVEALRAKADELGDVRLIIIDPPAAHLGGKTDSYKESDVREALAPYAELANQTGALVLLIVHLNKRSDGSPQQRFGGSTAWTAVPRFAYVVAQDRLDGARYMLPAKHNLSDDTVGFRYRIEEATVNYPSGPIKTSRVVWEGRCPKSAEELLADQRPKPVTPALVEAKGFLLELLAAGQVSASEGFGQAEAAGISKSALKRAKAELSVRSERMNDEWHWSLPPDMPREGDIE